MYYTNEELDQYIAKVEETDPIAYLKKIVPSIVESLRKNPNNYLAFGVYWYHVKKVIQEHSKGDDWFYRDFYDQLIMEMSNHGSDFRNVVAALVYAAGTDYFSSSSHTYTWKGDPRVYILEDDDFYLQGELSEVPTEVATENVKRSAGSLRPLESKLEKKYNVKLDIFQFKGGIEFTKLIVPKEERDKGTGSKVMKEVIAYADKNGLVIGVTPSKDFGGTLGRLKKFYKRFGFIDNKGRNRDFSFKTDMIRNPKGEIAMEAVQIDFSSALGKPIGFLTQKIETFEREIEPTKHMDWHPLRTHPLDYINVPLEDRKGRPVKITREKNDFVVTIGEERSVFGDVIAVSGFLYKHGVGLPKKQRANLETMRLLDELSSIIVGNEEGRPDYIAGKIDEVSEQLAEKGVLDKHKDVIDQARAVLAKEMAKLKSTDTDSVAVPNDVRGYQYAIEKDGNVIASGGIPLMGDPEHETSKLEYYQKLADQTGGKLYLGKGKGFSSEVPGEPLIMGMTWDEIKAKQQGKGISKAVKSVMPDDAVMAYDAQATGTKSDDGKPIKIEGKLNQGLKDYFTANGIPEVGTVFENQGREITLKEITPRGDVSDVKMSYQVKGVDKEFPLTDIPVKAIEKEPWQMTKAEYESKYGKPSGNTTVTGGFDPHKSVIQIALNQGKTVPAEVLMDYPELKSITS